MRTSRLHIALGTLAVAGSLALLVAGCSSSKNTNNTPTTNGGNSATGGSTSNGGATTGETGGSTDNGGSTSSSAGNSSTGGSMGVGGGSACVPDTTKDCYSCPATTTDQFLNECSGASCQKFDNTAKGVPATLPTIP